MLADISEWSGVQQVYLEIFKPERLLRVPLLE